MPRQHLLGRGLSTRWTLDNTGYPLIYVPTIKKFVHLFPVTKSQFEKYLADNYMIGFDDTWYSSLLAESTPRGSIWTLPKHSLESLFITGMKPEEVISYAKWSDPEMRPPTISEWQRIWNWFKEFPECSPPIEIEGGMASTAHHLWHVILKTCNPVNVNELACLSGCIWEWVKDNKKGWMGMGSRTSHPFHNPLDPISPAFLQTRPRWFGFRLVRSSK